MNTQINLGVIVPFYNEQKFLDESVSRLLKIDIIEQIILVDDCSSDNSYSIAKNMVNNNSNISLTQTQQNGGKGAAVQKGLELMNNAIDAGYIKKGNSLSIEEISDFQPHQVKKNKLYLQGIKE